MEKCFSIIQEIQKSKKYFFKTEHIEMSRTNNLWMCSENAKRKGKESAIQL